MTQARRALRRRYSDAGTDDRLGRILQQLRSPDGEAREIAADDLDALGREGLTEDEGLDLLEAAASRFPPRRFEIQDTCADLVRAVAYHPTTAHVPVIVRMYRRYNAKAKAAALELLARLEDRSAAEAIMELVRANARAGRLRSLPTHILVDRPFHPDVYFPDLFEYLDVPDLTWPISEICLGWIDREAISGTDVAHHVAHLLKAYVPRRDVLLGLEAGTEHGIGPGHVALLRREAGLLLDLLGHVPTPAVQAELRRALGFRDIRLRFFAVVSLLRLGRLVPPADLAEIAQNPEMRVWLWEELERQGRTDLFPPDLRTQEKFAESDLVRWLAYPAELGKVPDEIELMQVVPLEPGIEGMILDYYVFRFRLGEPHWAAKDGWLAGVAGPYLRGATPGTPALGESTSRFEPWSRRSAEGHVGDLEHLRREWRERWREKA